MKDLTIKLRYEVVKAKLIYEERLRVWSAHTYSTFGYVAYMVAQDKLKEAKQKLVETSIKLEAHEWLNS